MGMRGTIKRLMADKGLGFIATDDGQEYFFHHSACPERSFEALREGQAVTFEKVAHGVVTDRVVQVR